MKKISLAIIVLVLFYSNAQSQPRGNHKNGENRHDKIEQLKMLKLIELLDLDEEEQISFLTRRKKHLEQQRTICEERDKLLSELEGNINSSEEVNYEERIGKIFSIENKLLYERANFIKSLLDILSYKQIAKVIIFEFKFNEELRDMLFNKHKDRNGMNRM